FLFNPYPALSQISFHILNSGAWYFAGSFFCKIFSYLKEIDKLFNSYTMVNSHLPQHLHNCYRAVISVTAQVAGIAIEAGPDHFGLKHTPVVLQHVLHHLTRIVVGKSSCRTGSRAGSALNTAVKPQRGRCPDALLCGFC